MMRATRCHTAITALTVLVFAPLVHAGAVVDLALQDAPFICGAQAEAAFGHRTALGDLDGDGELELVVSAPGLTDSTGIAHVGGVFVFDKSILNALSGRTDAAGAARATLVGSADHGRFGAELAVGDLDADGFDDLVVGAPAAGDGSDLARGEVSVYFGGPEGSWSLGPGSAPELILGGSSAGARLGSALLAADIDGDGAHELLIAEPGGSGAVHLLTGAALRSVWGIAAVADLSAASVVGGAPGSTPAGLAVADTDGDGAAELILGVAQADGPGTDLPHAGRVYVVPVRSVLEGQSVDLAPNDSVAGVTARGFLGRSISVGDIDYDGVDDLLVSAYGSTAGGPKLEATGEAFVLFGGPGDSDREEAPAARAGLLAARLDDPSVPRFEGGSRSDLFGLPVLLADLNGDGADDIVASSQYADGPDDDRSACGEVYVYWGSLRSVMLAKAGTSDLADVTIAGASEEDSIGESLLVLELAEDGPPSLIIGAPNASVSADDGGELPRCGKLVFVPGDLFSR